MQIYRPPEESQQTSRPRVNSRGTPIDSNGISLSPGRFQFYPTSDGGHLLDTCTGKLWRLNDITLIEIEV